jgi:hypothetical protein
MSISEVVLFISTTSKMCINPVKFIQQYKLPITIIRLDTQEVRERAIYNSNLSVKHVPSIAVNFTDGRLKFFEGQQKVMQVLMKLTPKNKPDTNYNSSSLNQITQDNEEVHDTPIDDVQEEIEIEPVKKKGKKKNNKKKKKVHFESEENPETPTDIEFIQNSDDEYAGRYTTETGRKARPIPGADLLSTGNNVTLGKKPKKGYINDAKEMEQQWKQYQKGLENN